MRSSIANASVHDQIWDTFDCCWLAVTKHGAHVGGHALVHLHSRAADLATALPKTGGARVHLGTLACMTGVSRFVESQPGWTYSKVRCSTCT